jgi:glucose/arabinose dehydrogenase
MKTRSKFVCRVGFSARATVIVFTLIAAPAFLAPAGAQPPPALPELVDSNLRVRAAVTGLQSPTSMAFLGPNDLFVLEKATGRVLRVTNGVTTTVLDLAVNSGSERGLLGIALHPNFPGNPGVYLYWTESTTGGDSTGLNQTTLLGNRVDRYNWGGGTLTFDRTLIRMRALQAPFEAEPSENGRGNHNGGPLRFGPDGKLYIYAGDRGRRGQMQNLPDGPGRDPQTTMAGPQLVGNQPDDPEGGPEPDDEHLTGVILRLNDDGSSPTDNPFYAAGAKRIAAAGGYQPEVEAGRNLQKVFAYGIRNGFGMAFDPASGALWEAQNGDDSFTELNLVERGANLGWVQVMGPLDRVAQFKAIETSTEFFGLQQARWSPVNIADTPQQALERMFMVYDGGAEFGSVLTGAEENPPVTTSGRAVAHFTEVNGMINFELWAAAPITAVTMAHIHLGAYKQNGPIVAFLYNGPTRNFAAGDLIARGMLNDASVLPQPRFVDTVAGLAERMRQGRAYVNVHTTANPGGEVRGQITVLDRDPVSHYSDPEFSWKFEVAPAGLGFINSRALGPQYEHDMIVGAARDFLFSGQLFRFQLTGNRRRITGDLVADNNAKYDVTGSETRVFGTGFGIGSDIHTGPNGNLFVVSLSHGIIYEIFRRPTGGGNGNNN